MRLHRLLTLWSHVTTPSTWLLFFWYHDTMADMSNIASFNNSDGLSPWIVQKLNNNFWSIVQKISDPEIVMVSGSTFPEPRTNEAMFYNTDTGDLYIWGEYIPAGEIDPVEGWRKVDTGFIHVDPNPPGVSEYERTTEFIWIDQSNSVYNPLYLWVGNDVEGYGWMDIGSIITAKVFGLSETFWLESDGFKDAVRAIINDPNI